MMKGVTVSAMLLSKASFTTGLWDKALDQDPCAFELYWTFAGLLNDPSDQSRAVGDLRRKSCGVPKQ